MQKLTCTPPARLLLSIRMEWHKLRHSRQTLFWSGVFKEGRVERLEKDAMSSVQKSYVVRGHMHDDVAEVAEPSVIEALGAPARRAIHRTRQWLLSRQDADGSWCAELEGDTILESETILLWAFLGREDSEPARRCADYLVKNQLSDGGWAMYPGGRLEISGSVKAYFALKLTGHDPSAEPMRRARNAILDHGGADAVNSFTR